MIAPKRKSWPRCDRILLALLGTGIAGEERDGRSIFTFDFEVVL